MTAPASVTRWWGYAGCAAVAVAVAACSSQPSTDVSAHTTTQRTAGASGFKSLDRLADAPAPRRIVIPAIAVDAPVVPLGVAADGTVQVPTRWGDVGWYDGGPRPGQPGPAVLLGHIDSKSGPAVFYKLRSLRAGDEVQVLRTDGSVVRFAVTRVARYPKARFPTADVYLPTLHPELRLVTCGGAFNFSTGHYVDNVIAYAVLRR